MARTVGKDAPVDLVTPLSPNLGSASKAGAPRFTGGPGITTPAPDLGMGSPGGRAAPRDMGGTPLTSPAPTGSDGGKVKTNVNSKSDTDAN